MRIDGHSVRRSRRSLAYRLRLIVLFLIVPISLLWSGVHGFTVDRGASLRKETEELFYHGFENYMAHAFPEDELRPITCKPLTRDRDNPARIEFNDALGNYSLTLIDSLSTLAILASSEPESAGNKPLRLFQDGVSALVEQYGDGHSGPSGQGLRARGFDLDSKVQVFETVIRGVGGLLSAHLFAVGDLPIQGYDPSKDQVAYAQAWNKHNISGPLDGIRWGNGFVYDGQLLRLAHDLASRIIPAFWTSTGLPYPRINLRDGVRFYENSRDNYNPVEGQCDAQGKGSAEITETCSAGAGSLVLEFSVLSRLTGDERFEDLAKRAFWAVWNRRSAVDLLGAGIDAESGQWIGSYTGIGAGIDSFFEYAFKSYVLLSNDFHPPALPIKSDCDPRILFEPLTIEDHSPEAFLQAWEVSHAAIRRHVFRGSNFQHGHYIQVDMSTGAARAFWVDALSAFYPGLLTISGYVEEAIETHLLPTAIWARYSALPERYNLVTGTIEGGLGWWVGRPEFIESNYYLFRATEDPWYFHVAEMTLKDIKRRCWAACGWASLQNVVTGEQADRMESFFLGETAKYLYLTFDPDHPLNHLTEPFVFSTEGHPLIIPRSAGKTKVKAGASKRNDKTCPTKPATQPLGMSATAARGDIYHAASLARLHLMPEKDQTETSLIEYAANHPMVDGSNDVSPSNFTYYPWTLPPGLIPHDATSAMMPTRPTFDISFPAMANPGQPGPPLQRVKEGILINFLGGLRLAMVQDVPLLTDEASADGYRIQAINNVALGKDEKVFLARDTGSDVLSPADPNFTRIRDPIMLDLVIDVIMPENVGSDKNETVTEMTIDLPGVDANAIAMSTMRAAWSSLVSQIANLVPDPQQIRLPLRQHQTTPAGISKPDRVSLAAISPTGPGAAPLPDWHEMPPLTAPGYAETPLDWTAIYMTDELCNHRLPQSVPRLHQIIVIKRGRCSFSEKLANIPMFAPSPKSLQLVIVVSFRSDEEPDDVNEDEILIRPMLEKLQMTHNGLTRSNPLAMVMTGGGMKTYNALKHARGVGVKRRYSMRSQGIPITNLIIL